MIHDRQTLKRIRNKVKKGWELRDDKFEALLNEQYAKINRSAFDDISLFDFLIRFCSIYKPLFSTQLAIYPSDNEPSDPFHDVPLKPDGRYTFLWSWLIRKKIETIVEFQFAITIASFEMKTWIDESLKTDYIKRELDRMDAILYQKNNEDKEFADVEAIRKSFEGGEYPDIFHTDIDSIGLVILIYKYKRYLRDQLKIETNTEDKITIQGKISGESDSTGNIVITVPLEKITQSIKDQITLQQPPVVKETSNSENIKLYTSQQVSKMLNVSLKTLIEWRKNGTITACRIGNKQIRFTEQAVSEAIKRINVNPLAE